MKHYYKLTCFFFHYLKWITLGTILLTAAAELGWLWFVSGRAGSAYTTYQNLVYQDGQTVHLSRIFSAAFGLFCLLLSLWIMGCFRGRRGSIYTLLTLPGPRAALPCAMFTAILVCMALFFLAQCAVLFSGYHLWASRAPAAIQAYLAELQSADPAAREIVSSLAPQTFVNNDLYLAFVHSPVGAMVLPAAPLYALYPLGLCALLASACAFDLMRRSGICAAEVYLAVSLTGKTALSPDAAVYGALLLFAGCVMLGFTIHLARKTIFM